MLRPCPDCNGKGRIKRHYRYQRTGEITEEIHDCGHCHGLGVYDPVDKLRRKQLGEIAGYLFVATLIIVAVLIYGFAPGGWKFGSLVPAIIAIAVFLVSVADGISPIATGQLIKKLEAEDAWTDNKEKRLLGDDGELIALGELVEETKEHEHK